MYCPRTASMSLRLKNLSSIFVHEIKSDQASKQKSSKESVALLGLSQRSIKNSPTILFFKFLHQFVQWTRNPKTRFECKNSLFFWQCQEWWVFLNVRVFLSSWFMDSCSQLLYYSNNFFWKCIIKDIIGSSWKFKLF